jgi:hypothetical protein
VKIWAEGLPEPILAKNVLAEITKIEQSNFIQDVKIEIAPASMVQLDQEEDEQIPPLPSVSELSPELKEEAALDKKTRLNPLWYFFFVTILSCLFTFVFVKESESFQVRRYSKMSQLIHERINSDFRFNGWSEKIFFKEYIASDLSHIWLVTQSYQACDVDAFFRSMDGKILSIKNQEVSFKTSGRLQNHVAEFSSFQFQSGSKIIPGMYELELRAYNCSWDTTAAKLANFFAPVDPVYESKIKVILYPNGPVEFNLALGNLIKKKMDLEKHLKENQFLFLQDLLQKFQTLLAITEQIETHFSNLLTLGPSVFKKKMVQGVDRYTRTFGHLLTNFVMDNDQYFHQLRGLSDNSQKSQYETSLRLASKKIGLESMKVIDEIQNMKKPTTQKISDLRRDFKERFSHLKEDFNRQIVQLSELTSFDR